MSRDDMYINIKKSWYNKLIPSPDGREYIDDGKMYDMFNLCIEKNYFIDNEIDMLKELSNDLDKANELVKKRIKRIGDNYAK